MILQSENTEVIPLFKGTMNYHYNKHNDAPYLDVKIDRDRAYDLNISADAIEKAFQFAYSGGRISLINGTADQYDVIIETVPSAYKDPSVLDKLYISASTKTPIDEVNQNNNTGKTYATQVPLGEITTWEQTVGPLSISHINTLPSVTISSGGSAAASIRDS